MRRVYQNKLYAAGTLKGRVALVTGGSRGLGLILARYLKFLGAEVYICSRDPVELGRVDRDLKKIACDISDLGQVQKMIRRIMSEEGRIDVLINNAGIMQVAPFDALRVEDFRNSKNINWLGMVHVTQTVVPCMQRQAEGRIINITSIGGVVSVPHLLSYNCSKFACVGYSMGLRSELKDSNIQVTTVIPGLMRTGSFNRVEVKGNREREMDWFSISASLPVLTMNAERAARRILHFGLKGTPVVTVGAPAQLLRLFSALFPSITNRLLTWASRLMPKTPLDLAQNQEFAEGFRFRSPLSRSMLTGLGNRAARRYHEYRNAG